MKNTLYKGELVPKDKQNSVGEFKRKGNKIPNNKYKKNSKHFENKIYEKKESSRLFIIRLFWVISVLLCLLKRIEVCLIDSSVEFLMNRD